jgi:type VI secretion system secreted protein Hcp
MKINDIEGNVSAKNYEKWIELNSIQWEIKRNINTKPGKVADRESSRPAVSEFTISKNMDKTTPALFTEACVGKAKNQVEIHLCQTGDNISPYMQYTLNNVIISNYFISYEETIEHANVIYPQEIITLNFDKIEMKYIPYDEQHKAQSPIPAGYDLNTAQKM